MGGVRPRPDREAARPVADRPFARGLAGYPGVRLAFVGPRGRSARSHSDRGRIRRRCSVSPRSSRSCRCRWRLPRAAAQGVRRTPIRPRAVPRDALLYLEATVRPEGELREDALAAAGKVLQTPDPEAKLRELARLLDPRTSTTSATSGRGWASVRRCGSARGTVEGDDRPGLAAVIAATDLEEAEGAIEEAQAREKTRRPSARTRASTTRSTRTASRTPSRATSCWSATSPSSSRRSTRWRASRSPTRTATSSAVDALDGDRLAHFYMDTRRLFELGMKADPRRRRQFEQLKALSPFEKLPPAAAAFVADGSRLAIDGSIEIPEDATASSRSASLMGVGSTPLLEELPGDAWAAQGAPKFGRDDEADASTSPRARSAAAIAQEQLRSQFGIDLERDVFSWVGDVAFFVRGDTLDTVDGGAVIQVTDEAGRRGRVRPPRRRGSARAGRSTRGRWTIEGAETAFAVELPDDAEADRPGARGRQGRHRLRPGGRDRRAVPVGHARRQRALRAHAATCSATASSRRSCSPSARSSRSSTPAGSADAVVERGQAVPRGVRRARRRRRDATATRRPRAGLRGRARSRRDLARIASGTTAGTSAAATSSSTAGHEQERDDELDLRRGAGGGLGGALRRRARARAAPRRRARARAARRGGRRAAARRRAPAIPAAGQRRSSSRVGARPRGTPSATSPAARRSSAARQAGMPSADLAERAARREPGGDGDAQQVERRRPAPPRSTRAPRGGRGGRARRRGRGSRRRAAAASSAGPSRPGAAGQQRDRRAASAGDRRAGLDRHHVAERERRARPPRSGRSSPRGARAPKPAAEPRQQPTATRPARPSRRGARTRSTRARRRPGAASAPAAAARSVARVIAAVRARRDDGERSR